MTIRITKSHNTKGKNIESINGDEEVKIRSLDKVEGVVKCTALDFKA